MKVHGIHRGRIKIDPLNCSSRIRGAFVGFRVVEGRLYLGWQPHRNKVITDRERIGAGLMVPIDVTRTNELFLHLNSAPLSPVLKWPSTSHEGGCVIKGGINMAVARDNFMG